MRSLLPVIVAAAVIATGSMAFAGDTPFDKAHCGGRLIVRCPNCCHDCVFSADKEKVTKSCYDVECKDICIPRIVFPWQKGRCTCGKGDKDGKDACCLVHNGAKTKSVRVLKKYEYECPECKHKWTPISRYGDKTQDKEMETETPEAPPPPTVDARRVFVRPVVEGVATND